MSDTHDFLPNRKGFCKFIVNGKYCHHGKLAEIHNQSVAPPSVSVETSATKIDKEFEGMATDEVYQREAIELLGEDAANTKSAGGLLGSSVATSSPEAAPLSGEGGERTMLDMAACLSCGAEEYDVPLVNTEIGWRLRKKCGVCGGQLVSNPRRG